MDYNEQYKKFYYECKLECPCGGAYQRWNVNKHKKSKKHLFWVDNVAGRLTKEDYNEIRRVLSLRVIPDD